MPDRGHAQRLTSAATLRGNSPLPRDGWRTQLRPSPLPHRPWRVAMYSQGMVGFGHIRRNASLAQALRRSELRPAIAMIAEAWQAGALSLPAGVDCVTIPAVRRDADGVFDSRILEVSHHEVIALRAAVIRSVVAAFEPDLLLVDQWPIGAAGELIPALWQMRKRGRTRCVLGLRDVLYDADTVRRVWATSENLDAIRDWYDAVWIYGDPQIYDAVREYELPEEIVKKTRYTGYIDQRPRLEATRTTAESPLDHLPAGKFVLCVVGGGHDGAALVDAFSRAELPPGTRGVVVNGPLMGAADRRRARRIAQRRADLTMLDFVEDTTPLVARADRVIAMGGYNTVCEVLSFEKHALIVPRVHPEPEQWVRAERMQACGLLSVLHPDQLSANALSQWLARDLGAPPDAHRRLDMGALRRVPRLVSELLRASRPAPATASLRALGGSRR